MAWTDYDTAVGTLVTHIGNEAWENAETQLMVCQARLAQLAEGNNGGESYRFDSSRSLLKELEAKILAKRSQVNTNRFVLTRQNYASR